MVATHQPARFCKLEFSPQVANYSAPRETELALKRGRFLVGRTLSITRNSVSSRRRASSVPATSARGAESQPDEDSSGAEVENEPCLHLGRRMLLGSIVTAVTLSNLNSAVKPGWALSEALTKGGDSKGNNKSKSSAGESAAAPQILEKWKQSRVYDATVLGEPVAVGGERSRVWQKLMQARVVYLGEAERVPDADDRVGTFTLNPNFCNQGESMQEHLSG